MRRTLPRLGLIEKKDDERLKERRLGKKVTPLARRIMRLQDRLIIVTLPRYYIANPFLVIAIDSLPTIVTGVVILVSFSSLADVGALNRT